MKRLKRRAASLLLAIVMAASLLPTTALAVSYEEITGPGSGWTPFGLAKAIEGTDLQIGRAHV